MSPDGPSTGYRIENNVIHTSTGYPCMHIGDNRDSTISHNVCRNGADPPLRRQPGRREPEHHGAEQRGRHRQLGLQRMHRRPQRQPGRGQLRGRRRPLRLRHRLAGHRQRRHPHRPQRLRRRTARAPARRTRRRPTRRPRTHRPPTRRPPTRRRPTHRRPTRRPPTNTPTARFTSSPASPVTGQAVTFDAADSTCDGHAVHLHVGRRRLRRPRRRAVAAGQRAHAVVHLPRSQRQERPPDGRGRRRRHRHHAPPDHRDDGVDHAAARPTRRRPTRRPRTRRRPTRPATTPPPDTTIVSGPSGTTTDATPTFAFTSSEGNPAFECQVDSGPWIDCTSPWTPAALSGGDHVVAVRSTDVAGNTDPSPATRSFTVAGPPPALSVLLGTRRSSRSPTRSRPAAPKRSRRPRAHRAA